MKKFFPVHWIWGAATTAASLMSWPLMVPCVHANPTGGTVAQGAATFNTSGSQLTVNQTSANAYINWQSFNIGAGETTTFVQPSSSSLVWNQINDANPSQILGNLNANGYVVLQNQSGFYIGGQAAISTRGLILTTTPTPMPDLSSGGVWAFNTPPPTAKIINYGQINIAGGGSAFLIASDIENNGTISAPGGSIGLYAGQKVLVSMAPDGRGLSAEVTLPAGSVDNEGKLIADAGSIAAKAQFVNQNGLVQANSVQNLNGTIELVASDSINLGSGSKISETGDANATGASPGGFVVLNAGKNTFTDKAGSTISVAGANGGQSGIVEIMGNGVTAANLKSSYGNPYAMLINPNDMTLSSGALSTGVNPTLNLNALAKYSQIDLQALDNITLSTAWTLADSVNAAQLSLTAGNNINLNSSISAGNNWNVNMDAGTADSGTTKPNSGSDGIYLNGSSYLQSKNGDITLNAVNEVQVGWSGTSPGSGIANNGTGAIRTIGGGNIDVTTLYGDVNTGSSISGFNYISQAPYFSPFSKTGFGDAISFGTSSSLGGISTAAGGNVTITAGQDAISYLPTGTGTASATTDAGTGAFGSQPGNVTINARRNVVGHYVAVNGTGEINAGQDVGNASHNVALSLVAGSWSLNAQAGDIYLQEVRNPNGVFNTAGSVGSGGNHFFNYDPQAAVDLTAGKGVYLTGLNLPRTSDEVGLGSDKNLPILLPPTLNISTGAEGVTLENNFTLFPSIYGDLQITTTDDGDFSSGSAGGATYTLLMSDSSQTHWIPASLAPPGPPIFSALDHGDTPTELDDYNPVLIDIDGNMNNIVLQTSKETRIKVGGDMTDCSFYGQNLHAGDVTSIDVKGKISNTSSFTKVTLDQDIPNVPLNDLPPGTINNWQTALLLAVNPDLVEKLKIPANVDPSEYAAFLNGVLLFNKSIQTSFAYNDTTKQLIYAGPMTQSIWNNLNHMQLTVVRYGPDGNPLVEFTTDSKGQKTGHFVTDTITWVDPVKIQDLYTASQNAPNLGTSGAYAVGGTGAFNVGANSISLGNSYGILSLGNGKLVQNADYSYLAPYLQTQPGATITVTVAQDRTEIVDGVPTLIHSLEIPSSTIAALGGGDVNVISTGGSMDLGSPYLVPLEAKIMSADNLGLGIYTSGGGNVNVTALGDIDIDSSRIATFNGGNIFIESLTGDVNAGSGGNVAIPVNVFSPLATSLTQPFEYVYANGIVAQTLINASLIPDAATVPGNITVITPQGDIIANQGGILQEALNGNVSAGPTIDLIAGTPGAGGFDSKDTPIYVGNIDLKNAGAIGGTVNIKYTGKLDGLVISRQNSNITGQSLGGLTVLAGGNARVSAQQSGSGQGITIIGGQGVNASGVGDSANLLGQNVSVNGSAAQSTLGSSATATSASQSAAGTASDQAQQQVASDATGDDEDQKKKKKPQVRKMSRVTVFLSSSVPPQ